MGNTVKSVSVCTLKEKNGQPRFWLEGKRLNSAGFEPGRVFVVEQVKQGLVLKLADLGTNTVSKRTRSNGREDAIIDITRKEVLAPLEGCKTLRIVLGDGKIFISPLASEMRMVRRLKRLKERLLSGTPLQTAGVAAGGGILSHAVHSGLKKAEVPAHLHAYNEIREDLVEHALDNNDAITDQTVVLNLPLQELAYDEAVLQRVGEVDIVELGLPCSGASVAGRAKRGLAMPEEHPHVGHLAAGALAIIAKLNPSALIFENVVPYANSASAHILRGQLKDLGYDVHERQVFGPDFGDLEERTRWCMVAMTKGIPFDFESMPLPEVEERILQSVMEPLENVEHRWSAMEGLKAKQERDLAAGKNFRMQVFTGLEATIKTLTKGISKNRSTDPKFQHPLNPDLLRVPTAKEHGAVKGIPAPLFAGMSETTAHEMLGQSITYGAFEWVARWVGLKVKAWAESSDESIRSILNRIQDAALDDQPRGTQMAIAA